MTNMEMLRNSIGYNYPIRPEAFEAALLQNGLDPNAEWEKSRDFGLSQYFLAVNLLTSADKITESGYSVSFDKDALLKFIKAVADAWGIDDPNGFGSIKNATNKW